MNLMKLVRNMDNADFQQLEKIVAAESDRREEVDQLMGEINEKLHRLSGLLSGADSLCILNNLTGEVISAVEDWDGPEDDGNDYRAPEISVRMGVLRG